MMSGTARDLTFEWNGRTVKAVAGDTLASALWRAGVSTFARSRKLHRPLAWSGAHAVGALARVDGFPNIRLDQTPVRQGAVVTMQNCWPSAKFDVLRAMQLLPTKMVYGGFEHGALMPASGAPYRVAERMMAYLAGVADHAALSDVGQGAVDGARRAVDILIVGAGPEGIRAANLAVEHGATVALVTRGAELARFATAAGVEVPALKAGVDLYLETEVFAAYRGGALVVAAPVDGKGAATVFEPGEIVLATGRRSIPPMVRGNQLPGVFDAQAALNLTARHKVRLGARVAVFGTGDEVALAQRLKALGHTVVHVDAVAKLEAISGRARVKAVRVAGRKIVCDAVVHAGPWRADPNLPFQLSAEGEYQLLAAPLPDHVAVIGAAGLAAEPIFVPNAPDFEALVCPCMDVTVGELCHHIDQGERDPEVLKRLTSCGMGTCQGWPCWDSMLALLAARTGHAPDDYARPSHRPPRRAITIAQAAGLAGLVDPDK